MVERLVTSPVADLVPGSATRAPLL